MVKRQRSLKFPINVFTLKNVLRISYLQNGNTALHEAAWNGYSQCASVLLSANSNVNTHNKVRVVIWAHCTQGLNIGGVYVQSVCECPAVSQQQYEYSQQVERGYTVQEMVLVWVAFNLSVLDDRKELVLASLN